MMRRFGHKPWFAALFKRTLPHIDRATHRLSGGRLTLGSSVVPTFMLVHRGRRTGRTYRTPLAYIRVDGGFALAATNWGQRQHPAWSVNLVANPHTTVEVNGKTIQVRARLVDDQEKAALWSRFVEIWPAYDT